MGLRVLIVDDHDGFRGVARSMLSGEGFDVVGDAADGETAVRIASEIRPDLVLLDVHLPDRDGFEVAQTLSELAEAPAVVLISSRSVADLRARLSSSPAIGFITKAELTGAAIRALVGER